jgi:hypothetical protein
LFGYCNLIYVIFDWKNNNKKKKIERTKKLHISEKPATPLREAEQPVNRIVPLPLSTMPGTTFQILRKQKV